jgi:arginine decarboxylase
LEDAVALTKEHQTSAPIIEALKQHLSQDSSSIAIPGHKSGKGASEELLKLLGKQVFKADVSTQKGIDDRKESKRVRQTAEKLAAEAWGADHAYFSTNGSSLSNHVSMLSVAGPGDKVLIARNSHKSLVSSAIIGNVNPVFLEPDHDDVWDIEHGIAPEELEQKLIENPDTKGVFVVSPTYYGVTSDIATLADLCHRRGIPLIVDQAWGAHFAFSKKMPACAIRQGADMMVTSVHKTMGALEQASIMFLKGDLVPVDRFELAYDLVESTSPSVPMLAGIDASRRQFALHGEELIAETLELAKLARHELAKIEGVRVMGCEVLGTPTRYEMDETKVLFDISAWGVNGWTCEDWLISNKNVTLALSDDKRLLAGFTVGNDEKDLKKFLSGVRELWHWAKTARNAGKYDGQSSHIDPSLPPKSQLMSQSVMAPAKAIVANAEHVPTEQASGRIAAEMISPYPPGIPRLLPGERITDAQADYISKAREMGAFAMDASDLTLKTIRVVVE